VKGLAMVVDMSLFATLTGASIVPQSVVRMILFACMGCHLCQNPTFHEDMILAGYLEKQM